MWKIAIFPKVIQNHVLLNVLKISFFAKIWILEINFRILSERIGRGMSGKFNIQNVDLQFILAKAEFVNVNAQKRTRIETSEFVLNPGHTQPIFWPYLTPKWPHLTQIWRSTWQLPESAVVENLELMYIWNREIKIVGGSEKLYACSKGRV